MKNLTIEEKRIAVKVLREYDSRPIKCGINEFIKENNLETIEVEVGKVYRDEYSPGGMYYVTEIEEDRFYFFGVNCNGDWVEQDWYLFGGCRLVEVSPEEWEEVLINEATKMGFREGIKVSSVYDGVIRSTMGCLRIRSSNIHLCFSNVTIMYMGKWAEIVEEPLELTLEDIATKFGVNVEQIKIKK